MATRTLKHGYVITTYPCNNGFITETIDKFGRSIRCAYDFTKADSERRHNQFLSAI